MSGDTGGSDDTLAAPSDLGALRSLPPSEDLRLAGRYEILGLLGTGGMGAVYRALDTELGDVVALKMLHPALAADPEALERFRQEVRLARRVTHKNVARTFDIGEHQGARFLTMELVDGRSLAAVLAERGALAPAEAVQLARPVCAGLAAAHEAGVVHRDLKPENVLVARDGRVVVTDFGIARAHEGGASQLEKFVVGTPAYMAPEQLELSQPASMLADVYALGAVLFEMLAGRRAWEGDSARAVITARASASATPDPRASRPGLPAPIADVVLKCMARRPEDRYPSAADVARALDSALEAGRARPSLAPGVLSSRPADVVASLPGVPLVAGAGASRSVAVLPLTNLGSPEDAYVADGLTDDLIDTLSTVRALRVKPRGVVERWKGSNDDAQKIGLELGVEAIVHGSVRREGDAVRIAVRVTGTRDGYQLWARRFHAKIAELLVTSDEAASAIAQALTAELPEHQVPATDPAVVDLYLRARFELWRTWHETGAAAAALFDRALALAPDDPRLLAGAAIARVRKVFFGEGERDAEVARARELTERAVLVAPDFGDAWAALAVLRLNLADPRGAAAAVVSGLARAPRSAPLGELLGRLLSESGALDEARARLEHTVELDPTLLPARMELGRAYALLGDFTRSDRIFDETLPGERSVTRDAYRARYALWRRLPPPHEHDAPSTYMRLMAESMVAGALSPEHREFMRSRAESASSRLRAFYTQLNAELYALHGEVDPAFSSLAAAVDAALFDVAWMDHCPLFAPLRDDPRWGPLHAVVAARAAGVLEALGATRSAGPVG